MRKFKINVNGKSYEVEVEEIGGSTASYQAPASAPAPAAAPAPVAAPKAAAQTPKEGATTVSAPMPGTIMDIKVQNGAAVKSGDVLCILEAMKMENEIVAPCDGTVSAVCVSKGASVNTGDAIISIG